MSVKSGSRLAERYGDSNSMPESQQCRSNLDQNWLRSMRIVSEGMLESQQSQSNLDQDWLGSIGILPAGILESQHLLSNLDQDWLRGMGIRRYARITAVSVKSGSKLAGKY